MPKHQNTLNHILFYGTLRNGESRGRVRDGITYLGDVNINGELYNVGAFPALFPGDEEVVAELFRIDDQRCMETFDMIEGYRGDERTDLYTREQVTVGYDGEEVEAWVYYFNRGKDNLVKIESGDWLNRG